MSHSRVWRELFRFEIRYGLRQPLFGLVTFFLSLLLFIAGTGEGPSAPPARLNLNAPAATFELLVQGSYLVLFLMTAFVVSAAVRDFDRRTSEMFFSKPIRRFDYLTARWAGAVSVCVLACTIGVVALAASSFMPWVDPSRVGPFRLTPFLFVLGVIVLPTLIALGAAFYALATFTRSTVATYVGVVAFFALSTTAGFVASRAGSAWLGELIDPFGVTALGASVKGWTTAQLNTTIPQVTGTLLLNRLLWLTLGFSALAAVVVTFDPSRSRTRAAANRNPVDDLPEAQWPNRLNRATVTSVHRVFSGGTMLAQFAHRVRRETALVLRGFPFLGMLTLGLVVLLQGASAAGGLFGMPVHPRTGMMVEALQGGYSIVLLLVVVLYSGELIWKERALELEEVVDAMPVPSGVLFGAKLTALLVTIAVFLAAGVLALVGYQLANGFRDIEPGVYARGALIAAVYPALMVVLSCFFHVVAPGRFAGYGLVMLFIIAWDMLEELGFEHRLYRYASLPSVPYSDLNRHGHFLAPFGWYALYWAFGAVVLIGVSVLLWKRGTDVSWKRRLAEARGRFRGPTRLTIALSAVAFAWTGSWIFYNTNVLNEYTTVAEAADRRASYERQYKQYETLTLPRIVAVHADVDIHPERRSVELRGRYRVRNGSAASLRELHLSIPARVRVNGLTLPAHDVVLVDSVLGYRIVRLREALAPGAEIDIGFDLAIENRGFVNHGAATNIVANGTYVTKRELFPTIGYDAGRQATDPEEREERGLEPVLHMASADDAAALMTSVRSRDADRIAFESTVSTSLDQIAVTSGELVREWTANGRRYFHYRADVPITHFFAYASAAYDVTRDRWNGVAIEVYHSPRHRENIARMIDAAKKSLAYNAANLSAYQHRSLRIVEFPRYIRDGTSFPGMIALSESAGFDARIDGAQSIDFPFYITAHEVAHQWWGQQLVAANVQGAAVLHETLAQYSALMVTAREIGGERITRVLDFEREQYVRGRSAARGEEPPLVKVEREEYLYYHRGALAMWELRGLLGEPQINRALASLLSNAAGGRGYPTANSLLAALRSVAPDSTRSRVVRLFEKDR